MINENLPMTKFSPPVFRQLAGAVFGMFFTVTNGYSGLEFVLALLFSPILFAGVIRLMIGLYRISLKLTAKKTYNELGECVVQIPRKGLAAALTCVGFGCVSYAVVSAFWLSTFVGVAVTCVLMALETYTFLKDVRKEKSKQK